MGEQTLEITCKYTQPVGNATALYAGQLGPSALIATAQSTDLLFPTRHVEANVGQSSEARSTSCEALDDLVIRSGEQRYDIYDYLGRNNVVGLLVTKNGKTVCERYELGVASTTPWMSMSMAKSVSTSLVGAAIKDGYIGDISDPLSAYIPKLRSGVYADVPISDLLQMTSGVAWNDVHTDPNSDRRHMLKLQLEQSPGAIIEYLNSRPRNARPSEVWNYSTGETHLVGALVKAATGKWSADYLSEKFWKPMQAQQSAKWWLEATDGLEVAGAGLCATLRDYVRFVDFFMTEAEGSALPDGWVETATAPLVASEAGRHYGYMWWPVSDEDGRYRDGAFSARGIFGQYIYANPLKNIVIGVISARAKPRYAEVIPDDDVFRSIVAHLS
ncbi:MAG: serine hydrolase [Pseudomonadota bacterium]